MPGYIVKIDASYTQHDNIGITVSLIYCILLLRGYIVKIDASYTQHDNIGNPTPRLPTPWFVSSRNKRI